MDILSESWPLSLPCYLFVFSFSAATSLAASVTLGWSGPSLFVCASSWRRRSEVWSECAPRSNKRCDCVSECLHRHVLDSGSGLVHRSFVSVLRTESAQQTALGPTGGFNWLHMDRRYICELTDMILSWRKVQEKSKKSWFDQIYLSDSNGFGWWIVSQLGFTWEELAFISQVWSGAERYCVTDARCDVIYKCVSIISISWQSYRAYLTAYNSKWRRWRSLWEKETELEMMQAALGDQQAKPVLFPKHNTLICSFLLSLAWLYRRISLWVFL